MRIGVNTFGIGKNLKNDFSGTIKALREMGVTSIEPNIDFKQRTGKENLIWQSMKLLGILDGHYPYEKAGQTIAAFRKHGFEVHSIQADNLKWSAQAMQPVVEFAKKNSITYVTCSFKVDMIAQAKEILPEIEKIVALFQENGIQFLAHNHEAEFKDDQGTNVMTYFLENLPELGAELDVGWAEYAGVSSVEFMKKYGAQIPLIHIKDLKPGRMKDPREKTCVTPGTGIIPLREIMKESRKLPLDSEGYILDQDNSSRDDILRDIREGINNMKQC